MKWRYIGWLVLLAPLLMVVVSGCPETGRQAGEDVIRDWDSASDEELINFHGDRVPEEVWMKTYCAKKPPVLYDHRRHVEMGMVSCADCHHVDVRNIESCADCHQPKTDTEEVPKYSKAHHGLCRECHKKMKGDGVVEGKCVECHKQENTATSGANCPKPK